MYHFLDLLYGYLESYYNEILSKVTDDSPLTLFNYILTKVDDK